jgi:hypothetical protein
MPDAPGVPGVPEDAGALREADERLRALLADKDAKIAELEERIARLERLISRNSLLTQCRRALMTAGEEAAGGQGATGRGPQAG